MKNFFAMDNGKTHKIPQSPKYLSVTGGLFYNSFGFIPMLPIRAMSTPRFEALFTLMSRSVPAG